MYRAKRNGKNHAVLADAPAALAAAPERQPPRR